MLLVADSHQTNVNGSGTEIWRRREEREIEHGRAWEKRCALCDGPCESQSALSRNIFACTVQVRVCRDEGRIRVPRSGRPIVQRRSCISANGCGA